MGITGQPRALVRESPENLGKTSRRTTRCAQDVRKQMEQEESLWRRRRWLLLKGLSAVRAATPQASSQEEG